MKQWRILHSESSRGWGGQEVRVFTELLWMQQQGHWVALAAHPASAIARHAQEKGLTFYPLRTHKAWLPVEVVRLALWLRQHRVDLVNTHSSNDGWLAGLAARLAGKILIRSRHIEVDYPNRFWSGLAYRSLPHHVLTTSQRIAQRLVTELGVKEHNVTCVATGIDLHRFNPLVRGQVHEELHLPPDTTLVGMISVLRSWKGHRYFLEAAERIAQAYPRPIHFVIAGDGPGRQELVDQIARPPWQGLVTLLGHRADVPSVLGSLDVLVLPSFAHEGIPQIILQAQAMGRGIVATTVGGIPEVVTSEENGLLVPPRDSEALATAVLRLLDDPALREKLGRNALEKALRENGLDTMGQRLLALYDTLAEKN